MEKTPSTSFSLSSPLPPQKRLAFFKRNEWTKLVKNYDFVDVTLVVFSNYLRRFAGIENLVVQATFSFAYLAHETKLTNLRFLIFFFCNK